MYGFGVNQIMHNEHIIIHDQLYKLFIMAYHALGKY
jgi:hypothetical protein